MMPPLTSCLEQLTTPEVQEVAPTKDPIEDPIEEASLEDVEFIYEDANEELLLVQVRKARDNQTEH
jgi:hypothetical protein